MWSMAEHGEPEGSLVWGKYTGKTGDVFSLIDMKTNCKDPAGEKRNVFQVMNISR